MSLTGQPRLNRIDVVGDLSGWLTERGYGEIAGFASVVRPLAELVGDGPAALLTMAELLMPPLWRQSRTTGGTWVWAGGRHAFALGGHYRERESWGLAAVVVLAGEMNEAAPGYFPSVVERAGYMRARGAHYLGDGLITAGARGRFDETLRACASALLVDGWVRDLGED